MTKSEKFIQELLRIYAIVLRNMEGGIFSELDIQNKVEEVSSVFKLPEVLEPLALIEKAITDNDVPQFVKKCVELLDFDRENDFKIDMPLCIDIRCTQLMLEEKYKFTNALIDEDDDISESNILLTLFDIKLDEIIKQLRANSKISSDDERFLRGNASHYLQWVVLGYLDYYSKYEVHRELKKLKLRDYEEILENIFWFPKALLGTKLKHLPNRKYTDEMFEYCLNEYNVEGRRLSKAIELTLVHFKLSMNDFDGFRTQYYVYQKKFRTHKKVK